MSEPLLPFPEPAPGPALPTLHVTNWSGKRWHGIGAKLGIMASPRAWEQGDGRVPALQVPSSRLVQVKLGRVARADMLKAFETDLGAHRADLAPGALRRASLDLVQDGDTLCCCCSREDAERVLCHRVAVAHALASSGWRVILDGQQVR